MRRAGRITQEEFLRGILFARISASRSAAEKAAWRWFDIHGKSIKHAREFYLAVGHLTWYRLNGSVESFSSLFVKMLMEACITVTETEQVLDFSVSDYRAGALELISYYQSGKIDCKDVEIAIVAAVTSKSSGEAERVAQQLLFARHPRGFGDATPLNISFSVACLHLLRCYDNGNAAINETIAEIKRAVYEAEAQKSTAAPASIDPAIPNNVPDLVAQMVKEIMAGHVVRAWNNDNFASIQVNHVLYLFRVADLRVTRDQD